MKTVFHLNSAGVEKQSKVLGNLKNLREDETVDVELALVVNGDAVKVLKEGSEAEKFIREELEQGVAVKACSNSLENRGITAQELLDGVETVPSAVGELTRLQDSGYGYIKP